MLAEYFGAMPVMKAGGMNRKCASISKIPSVRVILNASGIWDKSFRICGERFAADSATSSGPCMLKNSIQ